MSGGKAKTTAENLIERFDTGEDVSDYFDFENAVMVCPEEGTETRRVNVDFPAWVVDALDREARRIGVGRQAVIKMWIVEHLDKERDRLRSA